MPRDGDRDSLYLADIVEAAQTVARWIHDHDSDWEDDEILLNAVLRQLTVVGEAASCLSQEAPRTDYRRFLGEGFVAFAITLSTLTSALTGRSSARSLPWICLICGYGQ